jgi:hypothetical protein
MSKKRKTPNTIMYIDNTMSKKHKTPNKIMDIDLNLMDGQPTYLYDIPVYSFEDDEVNKLLHNSNYIIVSHILIS